MPKPESSGILLLDTHVWVWLMQGAADLKPAVRSAIATASRANRLYISAISIWEIAMLEARGRLIFSEDCRQWIGRALGAPGVELVLLTPDIAIASTRLPGAFRGDPADRILIATARELGGTLATADRAIRRYARSGHLRVLSA